MRDTITGRLLSGTAIALCASAITQAQAQELDTVGPVPGSIFVDDYKLSISANGLVAAGGTNSATNGPAFRWTLEDGMETLGYLPGGNSSWAFGVSDTGAYIAGFSTTDGGSELATHAFRWDAVNGMVDIHDNAALGASWARDISNDGAVVVGDAVTVDAGTVGRIFRWTESDGMQLLDMLEGADKEFAHAVSGDRSTIVGDAYFGWDNKAIRWTAETGTVRLDPDDNFTFSTAYGVSHDGSVIVGQTLTAFIWTEETGIVEIPGLNGSMFTSTAYDVSDDGLVMVGTSQDGDNNYRAFRWTEATGMQTVEDWLTDNGAVIAAPFIGVADATNCDGSVVVGRTFDGDGFIARVSSENSCLAAATDGGSSEPAGDGGDGGSEEDGGDGGDEGDGGDAGYVLTEDLSNSLAATAGNTASVVNSMGTALNGAGSRPLDRRVKSPNRNIFWATGDIGRDDHEERDGTIMLGEIGVGRDFGVVQVNGAVGASHLTQNTLLGGSTEIAATYAKFEALSPLVKAGNGTVWLAVTGVGMFGHADITRNYYVNGGLVDSSHGDSDIAGGGIRARLQWENALPHLSPYGEVAWSGACLDAYTESGGAFNASFDRQCASSTEGRIGIDATVPVTPSLRLTGTLEGVHRFEGGNGTVSGEVIGIGSFNLSGVSGQESWLRGGAGFEADLNGSTLSMMLNATTTGENANAWLSASWRTSF